MHLRSALAATAALITVCAPCSAQPAGEERASAEVRRHTLATGAFSDAVARRLQVPAGFEARVFASGLGQPRMMEVGPDGTVYVTRRGDNDVLALRDADGDGKAEQRRVFAQLPGVHGIALHDGALYLATSTTIWRADLDRPVLRLVVNDLPDGGQHANRVVRFGPDGQMYVSVGSSCNDCAEENQLERGTMMRFSPDGLRREVMAKGLRNTIGFDWSLRTGELWGMDNGTDFHGDTVPPEELNQIRDGANYGWPICYADRTVDPMTNATPDRLALRPGQAQPSGEPMTRSAYCGLTEPARLLAPAHAAPMDLRFMRGRLMPPTWRQDALVAWHGSWNRDVPSGYKVVRIVFDENGRPQRFEDFATGFVDAGAGLTYGRPVGLAFAADGAVLVSDDANGVIYRIAPRGR